MAKPTYQDIMNAIKETRKQKFMKVVQYHADNFQLNEQLYQQLSETMSDEDIAKLGPGWADHIKIRTES